MTFMTLENLKELKIWVNWKYVDRNGRRTKMPFNPQTDEPAKSNDSTTWGCYIDAFAAIKGGEYDGAGIMLTKLENGMRLCGIDIDGHKDGNNPLADEILEIFAGTYIERSPSGSGYHILFLVESDFTLGDGYYFKNPNTKLECYLGGLTNRYLTFTADVVADYPFVNMSAALDTFLNKYMRKSVARPNAPKIAQKAPSSSSVNNISAALDAARNARNGAKFVALFDHGDITAYSSDDSAADMALCGMLAFYLQGDYSLIDQAFRCSALYRPKWEREDYRSATINKAISGCKGKYFTPSSLSPQNMSNTLSDGDTDFIIFDAKGKPSDISTTALAEFVRQNEHFAFLNTGGEKPPCCFYDKSKGVYSVLTDKNLFLGEIKKHVEAVTPNLVKSRILDEVYRLLVTDRQRIAADTLNSDSNIINFANGVLDLTTMELMPHSPDFLSSVQIPCEFNPDAGDCPVFTEYIKTLTEGDFEVGRLLWEYLGLVISNIMGCSSKQALFLVGKGDTGKSQYLALLSHLVGLENYTSIDLSGLEQRFGTFSLYGKRLAGCPDMSYMDIAEVKTFKKITGGDAISFEQKGRDTITAKYKGCMIFCANEMPKFGGDKGDHVYSRMLCVPCNNVIPIQKRDPHLLDKMLCEQDAIVCKAIKHLLNFIARGNKFDEPSACKKFREQYKVENDNVLLFLRECTEPRDMEDRSSLATSKKEMYRAYKNYCSENGFRGFATKTQFIKRLETEGITEMRFGREGRRCYSVELTQEAFETYLTW